MKLAFFGTPEAGVPYLRQLAQEHEIVAVVTQPDAPQGRGRQLTPSPVKEEALRLSLPVLQPRRVKAEQFCAREELQAAELIVVVAYGQILPAELCATQQRPALNVHYSLLPDLRGAAPVQRALLEGRKRTGITVQYVAQELDAGDVILQREIEIAPEDDTGSLLEKLAVAGVPALSEALRELERGEAPRQPQEHARATWAPPLRPEEAAVSWNQPAQLIVNQIRAFSPYPGAYCHYLDHRLKLFRPKWVAHDLQEEKPGQIVNLSAAGLTVQAETGGVLVGEVQPQGKRRMSAADFARGARLGVGARLEDG